MIRILLFITVLQFSSNVCACHRDVLGIEPVDSVISYLESERMADSRAREELKEIIDFFQTHKDRVKLQSEATKLKIAILGNAVPFIRPKTLKKLKEGEWKSYQKLTCLNHTLLATPEMMETILEMIFLPAFFSSNHEGPRYTVEKLQGDKVTWAKLPKTLHLADGKTYTVWRMDDYEYNSLDDVCLNSNYVLHNFSKKRKRINEEAEKEKVSFK